jgi:hypothetical protein
MSGMQGSLQRMGLVLAGTAFGMAAAAQGQTGVKPADLIGTWQYAPKPTPPNQFGYAFVSRTLTFRPDSTWLATQRTSVGADTFSCTSRYRWRLSGDSLASSPWWKEDFQTTKLVLRNQELLLGTYNGSGEVYKQVATPSAPIQDYIAPIAGPPATGKLAELVGLWEPTWHWYDDASDTSSAAREWRMRRPSRETFMFRPDLTQVTTQTWTVGKETWSCTEEEVWSAPVISADTLKLKVKGVSWKSYHWYVVHGQELVSLYVPSATEILKRVVYKKTQ